MNGLIKVKSIRMDERYLHVKLRDGRIISTPISWYPELLKATESQRANYFFIGEGLGIEWPDIDYHLSIESMLVQGTLTLLIKQERERRAKEAGIRFEPIEIEEIKPDGEVVFARGDSINEEVA
jgi:hypothetical protein